MSNRVTAAALFVLAAITLCACASPEELRAHDQAACTSYGFQPNTPEFSRCLQREQLARTYGGTPGLGLGFGFGFGGW